MESQKNLLLVDYQLDNLPKIHNIKLVDTIIVVIFDILTIENILIDQLKNNKLKRIGILGNKNDFININTLTNINTLPNIEFVNEQNYFYYLNEIKFNYNNNLVFDYLGTYKIDLQQVSILGGYFYILNFCELILYG